MKMRIHSIVTDLCGNARIVTRWALAVSALAAMIVVAVAVAQPGPTEPVLPEASPDRVAAGPQMQPEAGVRQEVADPLRAGRRNVLSRLRNQLQLQIQDTEATLRNTPNPEARAQVLRSELDTLREEAARVERQLNQLGRGPGRTGPREMGGEAPLSGELERRAADLRQRHQALSEKLRISKDRLRELGDQGQEAQELRGQIDRIAEELRDVERQMAGVRSERADAQRVNAPGDGRRPGMQGRLRQAVPGEGQEPAGRLRELREREAQLRDKLRGLGDQDREAAEGLERELDRVRAEIGEKERRMQAGGPVEPGMQGPRPAMEGRGLEPGIERVTRVYRLQYANPAQLQKIVAPLLASGAGKVASDERTGSLIVSDTPDGQDRIQGLIAQLDVQGTGQRPAGNDVDELRSQVKGLQEQIQKMQSALDQMVGHRGQDRPWPPEQEVKKD